MSGRHFWSDRWPEPAAIFDGVAGDYERYRPGYPQASLRRLLAYAGRVEAALDLGCGTGILTRALARALPDAVLIGADPGRGMLARAAAATAAAPSPAWLACRAEALAVADGRLDLITVAQAAHWFDRPAFYRECARALRPGGTLAVLHNDRVAGSPVGEAHEALLSRLAPGYRRGYRDIDVAAELRRTGSARDVEVRRRPWSWRRSVEQFIGYLRSTSHFRVALAHRPEREIVAAYAEALAPLADAEEGLEIPCETVLTLARFGLRARPGARRSEAARRAPDPRAC